MGISTLKRFFRPGWGWPLTHHILHAAAYPIALASLAFTWLAFESLDSAWVWPAWGFSVFSLAYAIAVQFLPPADLPPLWWVRVGEWRDCRRRRAQAKS